MSATASGDLAQASAAPSGGPAQASAAATWRREQRRLSAGRAALVVACALIFLFLMAPLLIVIPVSFSSAQYLVFPPPGFSLQ